MTKKIFITGANGFLGYRLCQYYRKKGYDVVGMSHGDMDFTCRSMVLEAMEREQPEIAIHAGAISDIRACQENPEHSFLVNVEGTRHMAEACEAFGARLIFCSSDQVYMDNGVRVPHGETEPLSPKSVYGRQKIQAETEAMRYCSDTICLRIPWLFSFDQRDGEEHGNLVTLAGNAVQKQEPIAFPIYDYRSITDVWEIVRHMERVFSLKPGIYNYGSDNELSTYEVAELLFEAMRWDKIYLGKNTETFLDCPRNLRMDTQRIRQAEICLPFTKDSIGKGSRMDYNKNSRKK